MTNYVDYSYWGMNTIWWFFWVLFVLWIFATPYDIPGQRNSMSAMDILRKRLASGSITKEEFTERKELLEN